MSTIRKDDKPPTHDKGERIIARDVTVSAGIYSSNTAAAKPGDSTPTYSGVSIRIEEEESRRMVMSFDMSIVQWTKLVETSMSGRVSDNRAPRAAVTWLPVGTELEADVPWKEPDYVKLSKELRGSLNAALAEYEEAVTELEALHSEKAGRAAMSEGIRGCRTAISQAVGAVAHANRKLSEHVDECLRNMLVDERFSAVVRETE